MTAHPCTSAHSFPRLDVTQAVLIEWDLQRGQTPRAATCAHACRRAVFTAAVIRRSARAPPRAISASVRHAVGTDATSPNSSR